MNKLKYFKISFAELAKRLHATVAEGLRKGLQITAMQVRVLSRALYFIYVTLAQMIERLTCNEVVVSSILTRGGNFSGSSSIG